MKKITLFVCALAVCATAFATPQKASKLENASKAKQARLESQVIEKDMPAPLFKTIEEKEALVSSDTIVIPYAVPDAFHYGSNYRGAFHYSPTNYVAPYSEELAFYNDYNYVSSWLVNGQEIARDTAAVISLDKSFGDYLGITPVMQTPKIVLGDTAEYVFPDYQYGAAEIAELQAKYPGEDLSDWVGVMNGSCYVNPLTQCAIFSEDPTNSAYYPWDYGTYGSSTGGDYWYGTKLKNTFTSTDENITYFDTTAVLVSNPGVMYISSMLLGIWTRGTAFPAEDDHVRITLYPVDANTGFPAWDEPIASATAGAENLSGTGWNAILTFNFLDEDPVTHNFDTVPAIVKGDFYAVFDEYNDGTANFGFLSDDAMTTNAQTYFFFYYPAYGRIVYTTKYRTPANLLLSFNAYFPTVLDAPDVVTFKKGEPLTQTITISTNTWGEDYDFDADDWIDLEAETIYDEEDEHTYKVQLTITVEESDEARLGELNIWADGFEFTIQINQNDYSEAIEDVYFKTNGKSYNVLGQEVNDEYKGVIIRNGEKFIR